MDSARVFQIALTLVLLFGSVVLPLAGIMSTHVTKEDFKRDVRKGF